MPHAAGSKGGYIGEQAASIKNKKYDPEFAHILLLISGWPQIDHLAMAGHWESCQSLLGSHLSSMNGMVPATKTGSGSGSWSGSTAFPTVLLLPLSFSHSLSNELPDSVA